MFNTLLGRRNWLGCLLLIGTTGCALTWDDVTSKEFKVSQLWTSPPTPMAVLETSTDGYARAKALNKLDEVHNDPTLQTKQIDLLQRVALTDMNPLCRMAAIRTLGRYNDPRAPKVLADVYYSDPPKMGAEYKALIRQQSLIALENTSPGEAKQIFIKAAKQPAAELTASAQRDRLEILDERLAAIRALGKYNAPDSVETLVGLLEKEKDVGIKQCAAESLRNITKKDIPADGKMWREFVATGKEPPPQGNSMLAVFSRTEMPNPVQAISNWVRPSNSPAVNTSTPSGMQPQGQPTMLPPSQPQPTNINQVQFAPPVPTAPPEPQRASSILPSFTNRNAVPQNAGPPTGSYTNSAGETVVPYGGPPISGTPSQSR